MHKVNINVHKLAWHLYIIKVAVFGLIKKAFYTRGIWGLAWLMPKSNGMHGMDTWIHYNREQAWE
jgi:hypothetical protein